MAYKPWTYTSVKGFRTAYKWRGLYPRGSITRIEKALQTSYSRAVLIKICFALQVFYKPFRSQVPEKEKAAKNTTNKKFRSHYCINLDSMMSKIDADCLGIH